MFNFNITHESKVFEQLTEQVTDAESVTVPPYYPDTPTVRRDIARNYDNIAEMDRRVGKLLKDLEDDRATDKIGEEDYREIHARLTGQVVEVMRRLDELRAERSKAEMEASRPIPHPRSGESA